MLTCQIFFECFCRKKNGNDTLFQGDAILVIVILFLSHVYSMLEKVVLLHPEKRTNLVNIKVINSKCSGLCKSFYRLQWF